MFLYRPRFTVTWMSVHAITFSSDIMSLSALSLSFDKKPSISHSFSNVAVYMCVSNVQIVMCHCVVLRLLGQWFVWAQGKVGFKPTYNLPASLVSCSLIGLKRISYLFFPHLNFTPCAFVCTCVCVHPYWTSVLYFVLAVAEEVFYGVYVPVSLSVCWSVQLLSH